MNMTGGEALARQLALEGVTEVFGVPGVQLDFAVDGLRQLGNRMRFLVPRHEQTAAYMADGYARTTGKFGTCMIVPGPGLLNAAAGLATAYACNSPVLCIAGNIHSSAIGKGYGLLHEIKNQTGVLASVTKWTGAAKSAQDVPGVIREAVRQLRTGRPQPVGVEIPFDVLSGRCDIDLSPVPEGEEYRTRPNPAAIERAAAILDQSRAPVVYVGGGALAAGASAALQAFAERLNAPVVMSENGRGALSDRHPLALNAVAGRAVFPNADVAVIVGSRFADSNVGEPSWPTAGLRYIYINVDETAWMSPRDAEVGIKADAVLALEALTAAVGARPKGDADLDRVRAWAQAQVDAVEPLASWVRHLRAGIPDDGILVNELTQVGYFARANYPVYLPGTFITPGYQGTLGYGFPTALGAAIGNPDRPVVSINGDGGFGWAMQELSTARKYNLKLAVVVFVDGHFGNVRSMMTEKFGTAFGSELANPRFDRLADAFEVGYAKAGSPAELETILHRHVRGDAPLLIEAPVGKLPSPWHLMRLRGSGPSMPAAASEPPAR
jgi:acetolactate synthase-1/2/3 large subunit